MTKEQFEKCEYDIVQCECCGRLVDIKTVSYHMLKQNGMLKRCNLCDWIFRHGRIPAICGFSEDHIKFAIEFILSETSVYINDLAFELHLTLDKTVDLVDNLKIKSKKYVVKLCCEYCGQPVEKSVSVYKKNKYFYCSTYCYHKHREDIVPRGHSSQFYNRIKTNCSCCGKEISVIPFNYRKTNKYGDNHNFCSQQCYWSYRSQYYIGEKSSVANIEFSPDRLEKMRKTAFENSRNSKRFDSSIQLLVNQILDANQIGYSREYIVKYYAIDNYLPDHGLFIEVMGDYWHSSPLKYNKSGRSINAIQQKTLQHDKQKYAYIKKHFSREILYLWENDIRSNG